MGAAFQPRFSWAGRRLLQQITSLNQIAGPEAGFAFGPRYLRHTASF
jgi:hypothetical protein